MEWRGALHRRTTQVDGANLSKPTGPRQRQLFSRSVENATMAAAVVVREVSGEVGGRIDE